MPPSFSFEMICCFTFSAASHTLGHISQQRSSLFTNILFGLLQILSISSQDLMRGHVTGTSSLFKKRMCLPGLVPYLSRVSV